MQRPGNIILDYYIQAKCLKYFLTINFNISLFSFQLFINVRNISRYFHSTFPTFGIVVLQQMMPPNFQRTIYLHQKAYSESCVWYLVGKKKEIFSDFDRLNVELRYKKHFSFLTDQRHRVIKMYPCHPEKNLVHAVIRSMNPSPHVFQWKYVSAYPTLGSAELVHVARGRGQRTGISTYPTLLGRLAAHRTESRQRLDPVSWTLSNHAGQKWRNVRYGRLYSVVVGAITSYARCGNDSV